MHRRFHVVVFDLKGNILGSMFLIEPPLNEVTVVKMHHEGSEVTAKASVTDSAEYMIITSTWEGIIGYRLHHNMNCTNRLRYGLP